MRQANQTWPKRLARGVAAAAVLAVVAALAAKWWVLPAVLRWQLDEYLPEYWDGSAEIDAIDFNYFGPVTLHGAALRDRAGRTWFRAATIRLTFRNWPSLHPLLTHVDIVAPRAVAYCVDGRCRSPLRKIPSEIWTEYLDLERVRIAAGLLEIVETAQPPERWDNLSLTVARRSGGYHLSLAPGHPLVVTDLEADGFVLRDDGLEVGRLAGRTAGGRLIASFRAAIAPGGEARFDGQAAAKEVDLARLGLPVRGLRRGTASGVCRFHGDGLDARRLAGSGRIFVDEADSRDVPAVAAVLRSAGLGEADDASDAEAEVHFQLRGTVLAVDRARLQGSSVAIDVEPGGTVDLWTGRMDVHVVVVVFEKARKLLRAIPFLGSMVDLTGSASRYHLRGDWSDTDRLTVTTQPMKEVPRGAKRFLAAAALGSGGLGQALLGSLGELFGGSDPNAPTSSAARP